MNQSAPLILDASALILINLKFIDIYNISGRHVYTLVDGYHSPGNLYRATWNSNTQSEISVSSGVYFYRMISGDFQKEVKMTIIK